MPMVDPGIGPVAVLQAGYFLTGNRARAHERGRGER
jgi:hypothetical protein